MSNGDVQNPRGILSAPTQADIMRTEKAVRKTVEQVAITNIDTISSAGEVHVRQLLPAEDLDAGADNGWNGTDRVFTQTGLNADQFNEVYSIDSDSKADRKAIAIYAITNLASDPTTAELEIQDGTGGLIEKQQTEGILVDEEVTGLFANPIVFGPDQNGSIRQYVTSDSDEIVYRGLVAEKTGRTLGDSSRFLSERRNNPGV